jgi:hypothetical protein
MVNIDYHRHPADMAEMDCCRKIIMNKIVDGSIIMNKIVDVFE